MGKKGLGVVLEGGGVKGSYHIGALKAFEEAGFQFSGYAGTSIGALNAAQLCQTDLGTLTKVWTDFKTSTIYDIDEDLLEKYKQSGMSMDFVRAAIKDRKNLKKYYEGTQMNIYQFVHGHLNEDDLRKSKKDLGFVTYCISDWEGVELMKEDAPEGQLVDFIEASATFPVFPPKIIAGKKYIDGGAWDNCPINLFAKNGYENMVVIRTGKKELKRELIKKDLNLLVVVPQEDLGKTMEFYPEFISRNMEYGYNDAKKIIEKYGEAFLQ